jgi:hypothetical protein
MKNKTQTKKTKGKIMSEGFILNVKKVSYESKVVDFGKAKLHIRPYPQSRSELIIRDGAMIFPGASAQDMFIYCLTGWENVNDDDKNPIALTDDIKKKIYDFKVGAIEIAGKKVPMSNFVIAEARKMTDEIGDDSKN